METAFVLMSKEVAVESIFILSAIAFVILFVLGCQWFSKWRFVYKGKKILKKNPEFKTLKSLVRDVSQYCEPTDKLREWLRVYKEYIKTGDTGRKNLLQKKLGIPD